MSHDDDDRDLFDKIMGRDDVLTYTDIIRQIDALKSEVDNLDDDSLVDEVNALQYNLDGPESRKIAKIALKNFLMRTYQKKRLSF
jgi:preprotein translocase subunit SecA